MPYSLIILTVNTIQPEALKTAFIKVQLQKKTYFLNNIEHVNHASDGESSDSIARYITRTQVITLLHSWVAVR
jgi:hypothetical protein